MTPSLRASSDYILLEAANPQITISNRRAYTVAFTALGLGTAFEAIALSIFTTNKSIFSEERPILALTVMGVWLQIMGMGALAFSICQSIVAVRRFEAQISDLPTLQ